MASPAHKKRKGKQAEAEPSLREIPRFKSFANESHHARYLSAKKVLPELIIEFDDTTFSPLNEQIKMRKWEKLTEPVQAVGYSMVREFYANAWEPEPSQRKRRSYMTMVRGVDISFAPSDIAKVLKLSQEPLPNVGSYHTRKANNDLRLDEVVEDLCVQGSDWVRYDDGRPRFLKRKDLEPAAKGWYEFVCRSLLPTTNRSEVNVDRAVLIHSIILGEDVRAEEIIAEQFYKAIYKNDLTSSLFFPSTIARLCKAKKVDIPGDTMIPQETPINGLSMMRVKPPKVAGQAAPSHAPSPPQHHQPSDISFTQFQAHFDQSMQHLYQKMDKQQEENREYFGALTARMDRMDDQLRFICHTNAMTNEEMYTPYQEVARTMKDMEAQNIAVLMGNLKIVKERNIKANQEYEKFIKEQEERERQKNKDEARMMEDESEEEDEEVWK